MRVIFFLIGILLLSSCDDGDFETPSFEFEPEIYGCGTYLFYRTTDALNEAYIVTLNLRDLPIQEEIQLDLPLTSDRTVTYRLFNGELGSDYFCNDIPSVQPETKEEWLATGGSMDIYTTQVLDPDDDSLIGFDHKIIINDLVLSYEGREIRQSTYTFGTVSTVIDTN